MIANDRNEVSLADNVPDVDISGPAVMHRRRVRRMLLLGGGFIAATSLCWGVFFCLRGLWILVALDLVAILLSGVTTWLALRNRLRAASRLQIAIMFVVLCCSAGFFDIPTIAAPRSMHQYLLAFGIASSLLTRDEPAWLSWGIALAFFGAYVCFASSNAGWATGLELPDSVRVPGTWINHAIALLFIFLTLHVIQSDVRERNALEVDLRDGLLRGELQLLYQPQVASDLRVIGAEALARWVHPRHGPISPGVFIPLAESSGLMPPLGDWVLRTACLQLVNWSRSSETRSLSLAVNVSASQFGQADFVARVRAILDESGADPSKLKLELTESMLAHDLEDIIAKMNLLKAHGVKFSLDDFGTGFSSLTYLRRLPLDQLKIDQAFVRDMLGSPRGAGVAETMVLLGRKLGLEVIAEGVETEAQRNFLHGIGCLNYQGFLFSKPLLSMEFASFMASRAIAAETAVGFAI
jgi:EAL domain-containing protein (putative c-di-GMP-specific phosphodiesterase class I)